MKSNSGVPPLPEQRVTVNLVGGRFDGSQADAPRDELGRILNEIWVGTAQSSGALLAHAELPEGASEQDPTLYRLESWVGVDPVYRSVVRAS